MATYKIGSTRRALDLTVRIAQLGVTADPVPLPTGAEHIFIPSVKR